MYASVKGKPEREREMRYLKLEVYVKKGVKRNIQCICWLVQRGIYINHKRIPYVTFFVGSYVHV